MPQGDGWPTPWFGMIFGPLMMIVLLVIAVTIAFVLMRAFGMGPPWWYRRDDYSDPGSRKRALEILEERFAKGEIQKDEFEEKKRMLSR